MPDTIPSVTTPRWLATEERLTRIETTLDEFRTHYATKADLAALEARMLKWIAGFVVGGLASIAGLTAVIVRVVGGG